MGNPNHLIGKEILGYQVDELIGSGGFGTVYKVSKTNESGRYVYALKHISLPTEIQYNDVLSSMGGDYSKANDYFKSVLQDIIYEINILSSLSDKNSTNVVAYYDNDIVKRETPLRYDIYIRMEYLTPLTTYIRNREIKVKDAIELGIQLLSALELCHSNKIIHRDIKDDNIFVSKDGTFKLGDFGIAKVLKDTSRAASMKGTPAFIAPEVFSGQDAYNHGVDLYSLGIVLYKLLNYARLPFLPAYPDDYGMDDVDKAIGKRLTGEIPGLPYNAQNRFGEVIVKAISSKDDRYSNARQFSEALIELKKSLPSEELERVINKHILEAASSYKTSSGQAYNTADNEATVGTGEAGSVQDRKILESNEYMTTLFMSVAAEQAVASSKQETANEEPKPGPNRYQNQADRVVRSKQNQPKLKGDIKRAHVTSVEKKDFIWAIYAAPVIIGIIGLVLFYTTIPDAIMKLVPVEAVRFVLHKILLFVVFIAFIVSLFFAGKQLQRKKEPLVPGAVLRGKDAYFQVMQISGSMKAAAGQLQQADSVKNVQEKVKRLEERLKAETDFGCGNERVTECENEIADKLQSLSEVIPNLEDDKKVQQAEQIVTSISGLLNRRRELTKR